MATEIQAIDITKPAATKLNEKPAPSLEQMKNLAAQFESVLLGQMMHQMRESMFGDSEEDGKSSGFSTGPLADQVYSQLSLTLSQSGGLGLSQALGPALVRQASPDAGKEKV